MISPNFYTDRFDSLEQLFDALQMLDIAGGVVRVHPGHFADRGITHLMETRARMNERGLRLIVTPAVGLECVELRRRRF
ncbi:MAG: hypothetical protein ACREON_15375 [Gemmatimonadaceae bacterium]